MVSGRQLCPRMTPLRLFVDGILGYRAQGADGPAISADGRARDFRSRGFIHERHELIGESRHGAADADSAHVGAAANSGHPAALGHIAVHYRTPASQLHDALGRAVHFGEVTLLVVSSSITAFVNRLAKQPSGA